MSEWITHRKPKASDAHKGVVWASRNDYTDSVPWRTVNKGEPWQPIKKPTPYKTPVKDFKLVQFENAEWGILNLETDEYVAYGIDWDKRSYAEQILEIYRSMKGWYRETE